MSAINACQALPCAVMPDVANQPLSAPQGTLNWVGMSQIELPIFVANPTGEQAQVLARVQAYVNLIDPTSKRDSHV